MVAFRNDNNSIVIIML